MIYQIDGKNVKEKPIGVFKKVVEVPNKLKNFITKCTWNLQNMCFEFWYKFTHIAIIKEKSSITVYVEGKQIY